MNTSSPFCPTPIRMLAYAAGSYVAQVHFELMANTLPIAPVSALVAGRRQSIDRTVAGLRLLPSNAAVAMKVLELKRNGNAGAADLARIISGDASLTGKVLA